jgi:ribosomal protein L28
MGNRNRRTWKPNVQRVHLWSESLQQRLPIKVTTTALGRIDQAGGLDNYILEQHPPESAFAVRLRERILLRRLQVEHQEQARESKGIVSTFGPG